MNKNLEEKIYSMSNSFLPLDMFYNDIRDNPVENYNKEQAYKDLEKIADFILDLHNNLFYLSFKDVYRTKAEAENYLHHANITRTETLPFLTWEEFKRKRELKFNSADSNYCELFIVNDFIYLQLGKEISMKQQNVGEATEENFYKAYDECVRLFRGGE